MKKSKSTIKLVGAVVAAAAVGVDTGQFSRKVRDNPDFPCEVVKGRRVYDVAKVQAWWKRNVKPRPRGRVVKRLSTTPSSTPPPMVTLPLVPPESSEILKVLNSGTASALDISRAVVQLISQQVAKSQLFSPNDLDALKKALGELRQAEADYLELAEKQGRLIDRDVVKQIIGTCCTRLVRCLGNLENAIGSEFAVWLADPAIHLMPADARSRKVREFVAKAGYEIRRQESEAIDKLIVQAKKDLEE